jgi:phosphoglycerate kinase
MKKTLKDVDVSGKRVLVRVDFNVPMDDELAGADGRVVDDTRIRAALPTIRYLMERQAKVIVLTHLGRPGGYVLESLRTDIVATRLADLLGAPVTKVANCIGPEVVAAVRAMQPGQVLFLENVRFHPGEVVNDARFAARLAEFADIFVNDAFASAHRVQASTVGITRFLPAYPGLLMENELEGLRGIRSVVKPPVVVLLGGFRLVDKANYMGHELQRDSRILLGGVLANTFLRARGLDVGQSEIEHEVLGIARGLYANNPNHIELPVDVVVTDSAAPGARARVVPVGSIPPTTCIVDIGPETIHKYGHILEKAGTVIWNGPLGAFLKPDSFRGTESIARQIASRTGAVRIVGGGETTAVLDRLGLAASVEYLSTGGAPFLTALEGHPLPAVTALDENQVTPQPAETGA